MAASALCRILGQAVFGRLGAFGGVFSQACVCVFFESQQEESNWTLSTLYPMAFRWPVFKVLTISTETNCMRSFRQALRKGALAMSEKPEAWLLAKQFKVFFDRRESSKCSFPYFSIFFLKTINCLFRCFQYF